MDYPNEKALYDSHRRYLDAMREFIYSYLEKMAPAEAEELIGLALNCQPGDDVMAAIDFGDIPYIFQRYWDDFFKQRFGYNKQRNFEGYDIRSVTRLISQCRNHSWGHPGVGDLDPEFTRTCLFLIVDILKEIGKLNVQREVENIRDRLFSHKDEEHIADVSDQLETARAENAELEKQLKAKSGRLEEMEAEWIACDKRLETVSTQLKITVAEKTVTEERLSDISNRFADVEVEKAELEKRLKVVEAEKAELEKRFPEEKDDEPPSDEKVGLPTGKEMEQPALTVLADEKEHRRVEIIDYLTEHFSLTDDERSYLSKTGQSEKHLTNKGLMERTRTGYYRITSRGLEVLGKNSSRGRNNKTDRAPEAPDRYTKRTRVKRINLPTGKEMEQPALEFLSDGREYPRIEIIDVLTDHFSLTKDQREMLSRSGRVELYLRNKGLIERTKTGYYRITDLGLEVLR